MMVSRSDAATRAIEAVWRNEAGKIVARVTRLVGDLGTAEDLAQDALVAALQQWPKSGVPDNPGAWLMTIAKRRAIDLLRRRTTAERKHEELAQQIEVERSASGAMDDALDVSIGDDLLRLIFTCCHPILATDARAALTLRLLGGLTTDEIARAFLVSVPTVAQRVVRAKRVLADAAVPYEVPSPDQLAARLDSVLEVIYLIFNEGYSATAGDDWVRPALCQEAVRLGLVLQDLCADQPEVHGLVALMEIQASRLGARIGPAGEPILLMAQDRTRWDSELIGNGLRSLERAYAASDGRGRYTIEAAIAACHARASTPEATDWSLIARLYDELLLLLPSPVVELNRAVAVAMAYGPAAGLELVDRLMPEPLLKSYHMLPSVRGDLLSKLGRTEEARREFERAAALARNSRERQLLLDRANSVAAAPERPASS